MGGDIVVCREKYEIDSYAKFETNAEWKVVGIKGPDEVVLQGPDNQIKTLDRNHEAWSFFDKKQSGCERAYIPGLSGSTSEDKYLEQNDTIITDGRYSPKGTEWKVIHIGIPYWRTRKQGKRQVFLQTDSSGFVPRWVPLKGDWSCFEKVKSRR